MSFGAVLARTADRYPDVLAIDDGIASRDYQLLDHRVDRLAAGFAAVGVVEGARVAVLAFNRVEFVETFYAICRIGAIVVPINHRSVADEIAYILEDAEVDTVVVQALFEAELQRALRLSGRACRVIVFDSDVPSISGALSYTDLLADRAPEFSPPDVGDDAVLAILYTSGTTGRPKGVVHTHLGFALNVLYRAQTQQLEPGREVMYGGLQLFHSGGLNTMLMAVTIGGGLLVSGAQSPTAAAIVDLLERHRATMCSLTPTQWERVCDVPGIEERSFALRRIGWGAASARPELLARMAELFGSIPIVTAYGQTETCGASFVFGGDEAKQNLGSIGRPMAHYRCRVVDDELHDVEVGQPGELVLRGPSVMVGYWRNDEANAQAFAGGWFHSGDVVTRDAEGRYWLVDRKKDVIISGGENIYPAEVERVLVTHPAVHEVAVVGASHPKWGETPVAYVVLHPDVLPPTEVEMLKFFQGRLASYKKPTRVVVVDALPRNTAGKVQRFLLSTTSSAVPTSH